MAVSVTDGYVEVAELKGSLSLSNETFADDDLARAINAASRLIDEWCGRMEGAFNQDPSDSSRIYTPTSRYKTLIDDVSSVTDVKTDNDGDGTFEITWDTSDFRAEPVNASADARPYTRVVVTPNGSYDFPNYKASVEITGTFGWPETPDLVVEACRIQASRLLKRTREAPFGVAGVSFDGEGMRLLSKLDADVELMLQPLRRADPPRPV